MAEHVSPTNDLAFHKVFASIGNEDILQGLIQDFFEIRPELGAITITTPYSIQSYRERLAQQSNDDTDDTGEAGRLRMTVQDVSADIEFAGFGAEMQVRQNPHFDVRSLKYTFDNFSRNYHVPGKMARRPDGSEMYYSSLKPIYALNIMKYAHFDEDDDALRVFTLYDRKRRKTFRREYVTIGYFELGKRNIETANQRQWRRFFVTGEAGADAPDYIRKAASIVEVANMSEEERKMMDRREYEIADHQSVMWGAEMRGEKRGEAIGEARGKAVGEAIGEARGEARGKAVGSKEKTFAITRKLLDMGLPLEKISEATGMSVEEIERLR